VAARAEEKRDHVGVRAFLATLSAQQIPADTLADRGARGAAVRLLTAHRSKGLEWRLVVVAHVQHEGWPDLRRRATLLHADRIGSTGLVPPVTPRELLMEERRLFYVACTRARERLIVTAVDSREDDGETPSRFLAELGVTVQRISGRPPRPLSLPGLVAELRRTVADPATSEPLRAAAARRLARLAPEVPIADPATWWGTRAASRATRPVAEPERPVPISATMLESLLTCPMHWFLEREAGGTPPAHQSANLGQLMHALAERVAEGELPDGPDVETATEALMAHVDAVWDRLDFRTPWSKALEHERVRAALGRFLVWHRTNPRTLLGTEQGFTTVVELDDGERVELHGYADRLELDAEGNVVVVDLKTGRRAPSGPEVQRNLQLALYQYAVDHGAVEGHVAGGAELVQLGILDGGPDAVVQPQDRHVDGEAPREALRASLALAAGRVRAEEFPAIAGDHCRGCAFLSLCPAKGAGSVVA
jgi:ATP-dependent exoDNAse (exonuclease V) beta subunit